MERHGLVAMLGDTASEHRNRLESTKADALRWGAHPDWPWNGVVLSAATRGGSARWDRNVAPRYDAELSWAVVDPLLADERKRRFETVGRFWRRTANWLETVYQHIRDTGGPARIRQALAPMDAETVISFWTAFPDVGEKYARNIMMDIYDIRFRDGRFAIDSRIKSLLPGLGYQSRARYGAQEAFLDGLASEVGVRGWGTRPAALPGTWEDCGGAPLIGAPAPVAHEARARGRLSTVCGDSVGWVSARVARKVPETPKRVGYQRRNWRARKDSNFQPPDS
jgi:hypothetical protein